MDYNNVFFMDRLWYFRRATRRWARVIRGDMSDRPGPTHIKTRCGTFPDKIDDLYVCASYDDFDGRGGFLAASGALLARSDEQWQPYAGVMYFDRKDMAWLRKRRNFRNLVVRVFVQESTIQMRRVLELTRLIFLCVYSFEKWPTLLVSRARFGSALEWPVLRILFRPARTTDPMLQPSGKPLVVATHLLRPRRTFPKSQTSSATTGAPSACLGKS